MFIGDLAFVCRPGLTTNQLVQFQTLPDMNILLESSHRLLLHFSWAV